MQLDFPLQESHRQGHNDKSYFPENTNTKAKSQ